MTGPRIEQLYCTHCTYGTAALHRAQDARRDQVFEYSARSGSIDQFRSHQVFQSIEQYVRFQLPGDTPAAEMVRLTAGTAPWKRLAYFPAVAGQCVLVRSCYRQRDTRDRPGSYFAHVLLGSATPAPQFSLVDALRMWGAAMWVSADSPDLPFDLPKLLPLPELPGYGGLINDAALLAFLTTPADANWDIAVSAAVREVVPKRWRTLDVAKRRKLLADLLATVLGLNIVRGDRLVVAVEPVLAALLFYGIARLVPFRAILERLSCSTCQSHFENAVATLSAVSFFDPQTADLTPEAYRGAALNTFNQKRGQLIRSHAAADMLVERFVQRGNTSEIEQIARRAETCGVVQLSDYEEILAAHAAVPAWRAPGTGEEPALPGSKAGRRYLQLSVLDELAAWGPDSAEWRVVAGAPRHVRRLLTLLASAEGRPAVVDRLYDLIDDNELRTLVVDSQSPAELKVRLLQRRIERTGQWPANCADLWNGRLPAGVPSDLVQQVCVALPRERFMPLQQWLLDSLSREPPENAADRYKNLLRVLMVRCRQDEADRRLLTSAFQPPRFTDDLGRAVLRDGPLASELTTAFPEQTAQLGACAAGVLDQLWSQTRTFREHFQMVRAVQALLPENHRSRWHAWMGVNDRLQQLAPLYASPPAWYDLLGRQNRLANIREVGEALAREADRALAGPEYNGKRGAEGKAETIQGIAQYVITERLPADFVERLVSAIRNEGWEPRPVAPPPPPSSNGAAAAEAAVASASEHVPVPRPRRRLLRSVALLLVLVGVAAGIWFSDVIPWARANVIEPLYAWMPKTGENPKTEDANSDSKATDSDKPNKPVAPAPKGKRPKADGNSEPKVIVVEGEPPATPDGATTPSKEEEPKNPSDPSVGENPNPIPTPGTQQAVPNGSHAQGHVSDHQRYNAGAHLSSVVVAESIPVALTIGAKGPPQPQSGFPRGIKEVRAHSPLIESRESNRADRPSLVVSSTRGPTIISLRSSKSPEPVKILEITYEDALTLQRLDFPGGSSESQEASEILATCVLELHYKDHARYVSLAGAPKRAPLTKEHAAFPLPEFFRWLGDKSPVVMGLGDWRPHPLSDIIWFEPNLGGDYGKELPFRLKPPLKNGQSQSELRLAMPSVQIAQIKKEREFLLRVGKLLAEKKIEVRNDPKGEAEKDSKKKPEWKWADYQEFCRRRGIQPASRPPSLVSDERKAWDAEWNRELPALMAEQQRLIAPLQRQFDQIEGSAAFRCTVGTVVLPTWNQRRLQSGIVVPVLEVEQGQP
ncbi:MAG TPA: hypothetical protein VHB77_12130 [Planctomycetaceae bacterium]|nr:hypothetical protein [Planctomycetaceae bacterium]